MLPLLPRPIAALLCAVLAGLLAGCDPGTYRIAPISFNAVHEGVQQEQFLRIHSLEGRAGATIGKILPGKYIVRGSYDLKKSTLDGGEISFGIRGKCLVYKDSGKSVFTVPKGKRQGSFTLSLVVKEFQGGAGIPAVTYSIEGSTQDTVALK